MSVPATVPAEKIAEAHAYVIQKLGTCKISKTTGRLSGHPYVTYQELARHLGYEIETQSDGINVGTIAGRLSEMEFPLSGILLGAMVVNGEKLVPGQGFFKYATTFGELPTGHVDPNGIKEIAMWNKHIRYAVSRYGK